MQGNKGMIAVVLSLVAMLLVGGGMYWSYSNSEVRLRNEAAAKQKKLTVVYDAVWKILQQKAGVSSQYAKDFKEFYPTLMEGRYGNERGGALMSWVSEHNPQFDISLYKDLMRSIEAERTKFAREQSRLIDIKREHDNVRLTIPSSIFVGGRPEIQMQLVTSTKTDEVFATGKENDIDLFGSSNR